jgi:citrate/tricarballylate utilization protein
MPKPELLAHGAHVMTVCNACRYCEQLCPVFPAMEERRTFAASDLSYLASLCHNCGECLYACQFAPPHEFGIDVPRTFARLRVATYEDCAWPLLAGATFRHAGVAASLGLAVLFSLLLLLAVWLTNPGTLLRARPSGDFYGVVPHAVLVSLFGAVSLGAALALGVGLGRYWATIRGTTARRVGARAVVRGLRDALTLTHLHSTGLDCSTNEDTRTPWRRLFHHATSYGFLLCFASTSVAAFYHVALGRVAPYPLTSVPVLLGTVGGVGVLVGALGLLGLARERDDALSSAEHRGLDASFLALLAVVSATGLALLALRDQTLMAALLIAHLGAVLALFITLPYGKFVHGFYRVAALVLYHAERN